MVSTATRDSAVETTSSPLSLASMGGMAAALSHEINQPLTAVAAYLSAAQRLLGRSFFKPSGVEDALAKAVAQVVRAGQIIGGMRAFVTRGEPDAIPQSMYELARGAYEAIPVAGLSGVEASFRVNSKEDRVLADLSRRLTSSCPM